MKQSLNQPQESQALSRQLWLHYLSASSANSITSSHRRNDSSLSAQSRREMDASQLRQKVALILEEVFQILDDVDESDFL